jgi:hypothetical protein
MEETCLTRGPGSQLNLIHSEGFILLIETQCAHSSVTGLLAVRGPPMGDNNILRSRLLSEKTAVET